MQSKYAFAQLSCGFKTISMRAIQAFDFAYSILGIITFFISGDIYGSVYLHHDWCKQNGSS